ncbi:ATP-binding cassette domain-containing protein, partial [bacterium]|nr:ATP-binding cassette domain-containing protein [bacterium]
LNAAGTIKRFSLEEMANLKTETRFIGLLESVYRSGLNSIFSSTSSGFLTQVITVIVLWVGTGYVLRTHITAGELLSFYAVIGYFTGPVSGIINYNKTLQDARIAADRLFEIFDLESEEDNGKIDLTPELVNNICFENVHFRYGTRVTVFESLNLQIKKGSFTAIVGESGSGKTTLVSLLHKLYPINGGHIRIGNTDISNYTNKSLRKIISCVPQDIDLFTGSIAENIAPAEFEPDMARIMQICNNLGMSGFIDSLPAGFNTMLGEHGANLSGGQKQRIAIARAMYLEPEILVLDEATSSLDPSSESFIQEALMEFVKSGRTLIVIAHRLSTISRADKIFVLDNGKVSEEGSYHELIESQGFFMEMLRHQSHTVNHKEEKQSIQVL